MPTFVLLCHRVLLRNASWSFDSSNSDLDYTVCQPDCSEWLIPVVYMFQMSALSSLGICEQKLGILFDHLSECNVPAPDTKRVIWADQVWSNNIRVGILCVSPKRIWDSVGSYGDWRCRQSRLRGLKPRVTLLGGCPANVARRDCSSSSLLGTHYLSKKIRVIIPSTWCIYWKIVCMSVSWSESWNLRMIPMNRREWTLCWHLRTIRV